jgi:hypothetical protein
VLSYRGRLEGLDNWSSDDDAGPFESSRERAAESTIASFIAPVTRSHGGASSTSIRFQSRSDSGSKRGPMAN